MPSYTSQCPGRGSSINGEAATGGQAGWVGSTLFGTWFEEMGITMVQLCFNYGITMVQLWYI